MDPSLEVVALITQPVGARAYLQELNLSDAEGDDLLQFSIRESMRFDYDTQEICIMATSRQFEVGFEYIITLSRQLQLANEDEKLDLVRCVVAPMRQQLLTEMRRVRDLPLEQARVMLQDAWGRGIQPMVHREVSRQLVFLRRNVLTRNIPRTATQVQDELSASFAREALTRVYTETTLRARQKAEALLRRCLNPAQLHDYNLFGAFKVLLKNDCEVRRFVPSHYTAPRGEYTIRTGSVFNVTGPDGAVYCTQLEDCAVIADNMLAQKLLLENTPEEFFRAANRRTPQSLAELTPYLEAVSAFSYHLGNNNP